VQGKSVKLFFGRSGNDKRGDLPQWPTASAAMLPAKQAPIN
jgi:hypothetical protein